RRADEPRANRAGASAAGAGRTIGRHRSGNPSTRDRKSTRLNSSHVETSYAVFCLKKKTLVPRNGCGRPGRAPERFLPLDITSLLLHVIFVSRFLLHQYVHSFPTRRSSDLRRADEPRANRAGASAAGAGRTIGRHRSGNPST